MNIFIEGRNFSSYAEIKTALDQYMSESGERFVLKDCRKLQSPTVPRRILSKSIPNWSLGYYRLKYECVYHGKNISHGQGLRKRKPWRTDCKAHIRFLLTPCTKFLEVASADFNHNHEIIPRPMTRDCLHAQRKTRKLMDELDVPYEIACQMEREEYYMKYPEKCPLEFNALKYQLNKTEEEFLENFTLSDSDESSTNSMDDSNPNDISEFNVDKQSSDNVTSNPQTRSDNFETPCDFSDDDDDECTSDNSDDVQSDRVYTKVGDSGFTYTFNGRKKYKDDDLFEALGIIEELCCTIGFAIEFIPNSGKIISEELRGIQNILQALVLHIGSPKSCETYVEDCSEFPEQHVSNLEKLISMHSRELHESLSTSKIILPSGGQSSSTLHVARTICRTAERKALCIVKRSDIDVTVLKFLNRLGDYLFVAARKISLICNDKEYFYEDTNCE